jgi:hypothetical protein
MDDCIDSDGVVSTTKKKSDSDADNVPVSVSEEEEAQMESYSSSSSAQSAKTTASKRECSLADVKTTKNEHVRTIVHLACTRTRPSARPHTPSGDERVRRIVHLARTRISHQFVAAEQDGEERKKHGHLVRLGQDRSIAPLNLSFLNSPSREF